MHEFTNKLLDDSHFKYILFLEKNATRIVHRKIRGIIGNIVHDHEKFVKASMKRRWSFNDGIFDAMYK